MAGISFVAALKLIPHGTNLRWPCSSSQLVEQDHQSGSHSAVWAGKISGVVQLNRKLHPLWCSPANSFKFQSCDRTSQAARLSLSLALQWLVANATLNGHRLRPGLLGYLIRFAPLGFVPHRRARSRRPPSPLVVLRRSLDFTLTYGIPSPSPVPK